MPSSFNTIDLFSSGPHRFFVGPMGSQLIENTALSPTTPGRQSIGPLDGDVTIRGRLIAPTDTDLWDLINTITAQITDPPTAGDLITSTPTPSKTSPSSPSPSSPPSTAPAKPPSSTKPVSPSSAPGPDSPLTRPV